MMKVVLISASRLDEGEHHEKLKLEEVINTTDRTGSESKTAAQGKN